MYITYNLYKLYIPDHRRAPFLSQRGSTPLKALERRRLGKLPFFRAERKKPFIPEQRPGTKGFFPESREGPPKKTPIGVLC
jgi:hypothetical protein